MKHIQRRVFRTLKANNFYRYCSPPQCFCFCSLTELGCSPEIETGNSPDGFGDVLFTFNVDEQQSVWEQTWQPGCDSSDTCRGYIDIPVSVDCNVEPGPDKRRLCHCMDRCKL